MSVDLEPHASPVVLTGADTIDSRSSFCGLAPRRNRRLANPLDFLSVLIPSCEVDSAPKIAPFIYPEMPGNRIGDFVEKMEAQIGKRVLTD